MITSLLLALAIPFEMPYDGKATIVIDDAAGQRVRNLVSGLPFAKGSHTVEWDGRTEAGTGANPGACTVRVFTHRGLSYDYKGSFGAGGEAGFSAFGPNHLPCSRTMARGDKVVVASLFTEGGNSTLVLNLDGSLHHGWGEGWNLGNEACLYLPGSDAAFYALREGKDNELQFLGYGWKDRKRPNVRLVSAEKTALRGAAQIGNTVYVANGLSQTIDVYRLDETPDGENIRAELVFTGERRPCAEPGPLAAVGTDLVTSFKPDQLSLTADDQFVYAVEKDVSVIRVYDRRTHALVRTIGEEGGGYAGAWKKDRLVRPTSCVLDAEGFLWVTENRYNPKRISRWDVRTGTCVFEKFGSERYGSPGSGMDEDDPTHWMAHDTEWRYDPASGVDAPIASSVDETLDNGCTRPPVTARTYRWVRRDGRTFVIGNDSAVVIWEYLADERRLKPLFMQTSPGFYAHRINRKNTCTAMGEAYRRAFPETAGKHDAFKYDEETLVVWHDRNGDECYQADEFSFGPRDSGATGGWGLFASDLDFTCCVTIDGAYSLLDFRYPDWSLEKALATRRPVTGALPPGVGPVRRTTQASTRDGHSVLLEMSPYMLGFDAQGKCDWYMKNPWIGVHGSHNASLPVPGELQGVLFSIGSVPCGVKGDREAMAVKNNHGRIYFITSDGIYLDELFTDCRVAAANNETYIGGESFGGSFQYDRKGKRAILTSGGGGYRWYEIHGLDTLEETSFVRTFTARELVAAQESHPLVDPKTVRRPVARVPRATKKGGRSRLAHWGSEAQSVSLDLALTDDALQLHYDVRDPSPWVNNGTDPYEMFKTGDCVDFQFLGADGTPERIMVSPQAGDPAKTQVVWYRHQAWEGNPHDFASPWRTHHVGDVRFPTNFPVRVQRHDGRYTVDLTLPRTLFAGREITCDFGVIFGDRDGTINQSRVYWANPETGLVNDVPGEIIPVPKKWGTLLLADGGTAKESAPIPQTLAFKDVSRPVNPRGSCATAGGNPLPGSDYGVGPVYDPQRRLLYYSTGAGRVIARTLDGSCGRLFTLPKARPFERFDALVRADSGALYVLAGGVSASNPQRRHPNAGLLFRIDPDASGDEAVTCLASNICAIAQHVRDGKLACMMPDSTVALYDIAANVFTPYGEAVRNGSSYPCMLDWTPQGELMSVVEHRNTYLYRDGKAVPGPSLFGSREICMQRGAIHGDELWVLAGGTIKRYDARTMRPVPGVVYGGASGYFIGYTKMNTEMEASGICPLGDGRYAVHTPENSALYVMRYDAAKQRLVEESRQGGVVSPRELLLDDEGMILCDGLVWPFDAVTDAPPRSTKIRMPRRAAAVLKDGTTVLVTETHGSKVEFRTGRLADERMKIDHRIDVKPYPEGSVPHHQKWGRAQPVATLVLPGEKDRSVLFAVLKDGTVKKYTVDAGGHPLGDDGWYAEARLPCPDGVSGEFRSAAALPDGRILAAVGGRLVTYAEQNGAWQVVAVDAEGRADALASDGPYVAIADAEAGTVSVCGYEDGRLRQLAKRKGLSVVDLVALRGNRLAVWQRDGQNLVLLRCHAPD